jgi:uncharacterized protein involved in exopolysaccharide biosynthesis
MQLSEYNQLKRQVESRRQEYDREQGAYQQTMRQLKEEFGCSSLDDAERLLSKLKRKVRTMEVDFRSNLKRFIKKHRHALK